MKSHDPSANPKLTKSAYRKLLIQFTIAAVLGTVAMIGLWASVLTHMEFCPSAKISDCPKSQSVNEPGQVTEAAHAQE